MNGLQFFLGVVRGQLFTTPRLPTESFAGQTVIVTGSNVGVGYEAVKHLIRLEASKIIIAVRTISKGEKAVERLVAETKCDPKRLEVWSFDLGSYDSIRKFVDRANGLDRLDAVIQNAGIMGSVGKFETIEGDEQTIRIDTLAPIYFAYLILPVLQRSAAKTGLTGRLTFVGSDAMYLGLGGLDTASPSIMEALNDPSASQIAAGMARYNVAKALLYYAQRTLVQKSPLSTKKVLINVNSPGMTKTTFGENRDGPSPWLLYVFRAIFYTTLARRGDVGARELINPIVPSVGPDAHGQFYWNNDFVSDDQNPVLTSPKAKAIQQRWESELNAYLERIQPGVTNI